MGASDQNDHALVIVGTLPQLRLNFHTPKNEPHQNDGVRQQSEAPPIYGRRSRSVTSTYSVDSISNPQASNSASGMYFEFLFRSAPSRRRGDRTYWSGVSLYSFTTCSNDVTVGVTGPIGSGLPQFGFPRRFAIISFFPLDIGIFIGFRLISLYSSLHILLLHTDAKYRVKDVKPHPYISLNVTENQAFWPRNLVYEPS